MENQANKEPEAVSCEPAGRAHNGKRQVGSAQHHHQIWKMIFLQRNLFLLLRKEVSDHTEAAFLSGYTSMLFQGDQEKSV